MCQLYFSRQAHEGPNSTQRSDISALSSGLCADSDQSLLDGTEVVAVMLIQGPYTWLESKHHEDPKEVLLCIKLNYSWQMNNIIRRLETENIPCDDVHGNERATKHNRSVHFVTNNRSTVDRDVL